MLDHRPSTGLPSAFIAWFGAAITLSHLTAALSFLGVAVATGGAIMAQISSRRMRSLEEKHKARMAAEEERAGQLKICLLCITGTPLNGACHQPPEDWPAACPKRKARDAADRGKAQKP